MATPHKEIFTTIRTLGGLFPADFLHRITDTKNGVKGTTPEAYHLSGHQKIT